MKKYFLVLIPILFFPALVIRFYPCQESFRRIHADSYIRDGAVLAEARLMNVLRLGDGGSIVVHTATGEHVARLSRSGARILRSEHMTNEQVLEGVAEGRYHVVSQQELIDKALEDRSRCILVNTGGGDSAGINAVIAGTYQELARLGSDMIMLGAHNATAALSVVPEDFPKQLILIDGLLARDIADQGSTVLGSSRQKPFSDETEQQRIVKEQAMQNISGFGGFLCTGGDDNLKTALEIARYSPDTVVIATAKTIDGDVMVNNHGVQSLGFNSAVHMYRDEIYSIAQSAFTHGENDQPNIMFIEAMGRDAGRLAFEAARGDNFEGLTDAEIRRQIELRDTIIVITPEYPVSLEEIRVAIQRKIDQYNACTVVVAEGFRILEDPSAGVDESEVDPAGHKHYEGIAQELASRLKPSFSTAKIRSNMYLTYEGRGVLPTDYDIAMGTNIGHMAARLLLEGTTGGRFVGYTNSMNPLVEGPVVLELTGISNGNDLRNTDLYDPQTLGRNGVLMP